MSAPRRLAAVVFGFGLGLGLLAVAPPASAAEPVVEWTRPTIEENVLVEQGPITGNITGEEGQTIHDLRLELEPEIAANDPEEKCFVDAPNNTTTTFDSDSSSESFELKLDFPCNRRYTLTATVGYDDGGLTDPVIGAEPVVSSIDFSVAIPPAQVQDVAVAYDEGTKEVRLTWEPNSEADLLGYFIERNPPGPSGFDRITPELLPPDQTSFTDPGIEDEHRYQVRAVRSGPEQESQLSGEPSSFVTAGPERTEPTLPDDLPPPNSKVPSRSGGSGGGGTARRSPPPPSQTRTTSNIFEGTLPFDPSQTTIPSSPAEPPADAAVLAEFDDDSTGEDRRATLVPIAGGLALVVGAMHLFLLSKRATEPDDIPMSHR